MLAYSEVAGSVLSVNLKLPPVLEKQRSLTRFNSWDWVSCKKQQEVCLIRKQTSNCEKERISFNHSWDSCLDIHLNTVDCEKTLNERDFSAYISFPNVAAQHTCSVTRNPVQQSPSLKINSELITSEMGNFEFSVWEQLIRVNLINLEYVHLELTACVTESRRQWSSIYVILWRLLSFTQIFVKLIIQL